MMSKTNSITPRALNWDGADAVASDLLYGEIGYGANGERLVGEGAYWQYVKQLYNTFNGTNISGNIIIYAPQATYMWATFQNCASLTSISLTVSQSVTSWRDTFNGCTNLQHIYGVLNFSSSGVEVYRTFLYCSALTTVSIATNGLVQSFSFLYSPLLSTDSLLSIANGIGAVITLTLHATSKNNCNNIMVDNVDGTAVLGSTMTLTQFITGIKGATIA